MILSQKRWSNASAFIKLHENGNITVYCKFYDDFGKGHFGCETDVLGKLEGFPEIPQEVIKKIEIKSFSNFLRKIFAPEKVKYQTRVLNKHEIINAEKRRSAFMKKFWAQNELELVAFFNDLWKKAKENEPSLTYEVEE